MGAADIPVDLLNPGQVFACLGLVEAADILLGDGRGGFDWSDPSNVRFRVVADGAQNPIEVVLDFLRNASVVAMGPAGCEHETSGWKVPTVPQSADEPYAYPSPESPATLSARLTATLTDADGQRRERALAIDYWGDSFAATRRDAFKLWGGAGGYPGAALARDALQLVRDGEVDAENPFAFAAPQSSSFRLDWRRDYIPIDAGFSPNRHSHVRMVGYPVVELLAAIGLSYARPQRDGRLSYRYAVVGAPDPLAPMFLRAALSGATLPFRQRFFLLDLGWSGQEGKERCITTVTEEKKR